MASTFISKPGTQYGPCASDRCGHHACQQQRNIALTVCRFCNALVGYDRHYYHDPEKQYGYVHAVCLEENLHTLTREASRGGN